jgi:uncharacterized protein YlaI
MTETLKERLLRYEKENRTLEQIGRKLGGLTRQRVDQIYREQLGRAKKHRDKPIKIFQCSKCGAVIETDRKYCVECRRDIMRVVMKPLIEYGRSPKGRKENSERKKLYWSDPKHRKRFGDLMRAAWRLGK